MNGGHIRQRGKRSFELKYDLGRDPVTGKRRIVYKTVRGGKRAAQAELVKELRALQTGDHVEPSHLTVADYLRRWLDGHAAQVAAKSAERDREIVEKHLIPGIGATQLQQLTPLQIQDHYTKSLASGRRQGKGGALSSNTVLRHHRVLFQALRQAVRWQLVARNVAEAVDAPKKGHREIEALDEAQLAKVLRTAQGTTSFLPILIAATTGARRGELLGMRWRDLDLDRARLHVAQVLEETAAGIAFKEPKTPRSRRVVTLPAITVEALRAHKAAQAETRLALGLGRDADALVFAEATGEPLRPRNLTKAFGRIVRKAGVRAVSFHALRHTHASHLLKAGTNPKIVSERLGHAGVAITLDTYSHVLPGLQDDVARVVDTAIRATLSGD